MWQRRQHKAQRRRQQNTRNKRDHFHFSWLVVGACALVALIALLHDHGEEEVNPRLKRRSNFAATRMLRCLSDYPRRFRTFYAPMLHQLVHWSSSMYQAIEISEDVTSALDCTVALLAITSVYHLIEIGRRAVLRSFRSSQIPELPDKNGREVIACDAF